MTESSVFSAAPIDRPSAGTIRRIRVENFMCHSSMEVELGRWVNFVTGQNGSGKSAILTAVCVAFGCRAKGTQRASSLKDFIKTGCSYAHVLVELENHGDDAFERDKFGDAIIVERRITESTSSVTLKNCEGKKVASGKKELGALVEHFNIDVENPCVIMSQDKSREFLHSGNSKDKFKFFYRATLLHQVSELLQGISMKLDAGTALVKELESSIMPFLKDLDMLREKIKNMEQVEEIAQQVQILKKKLAWSWVYDVDRQIQEHNLELEKLRGRVPQCQEKIDHFSSKVMELKALLVKKQADISSLMGRTSEVRRMKEELQHELSLATKEELELEEDYSRATNSLEKLASHARRLDQKVNDIQQKHIRDTQAEEIVIADEMNKLVEEIDRAQTTISRLQDEENAILHSLSLHKTSINAISKEEEEWDKKFQDLCMHKRQLQQQQSNKVVAFGGEKVLNLLQVIERHHRKFKCPPIGPIGAHVSLLHGDFWALAIDNAIGRLLNAFIVTDHKDSLLLRSCCKEANYHSLQIIVYDFSRPRLNIPSYMLPATNHPSILSVLHSDNPTVINVLVDMGNIERQVLVEEYDMGVSVAFDQRIKNLKDVYTSDGCRMFLRGSVQNILPPNRNIRTGRLCRSIDDQILNIETESMKVKELLQEAKGKKRQSEQTLRDLQMKDQTTKKRRIAEERFLRSKQLALQDMKSAYSTDRNAESQQNIDEFNEEILRVQNDMNEKDAALRKIKEKSIAVGEKVNNLKLSLKSLCDSTKGEINAIEEAERDLLTTDDELEAAKSKKSYYENVMQTKVLPDIKEAEAHYEELQANHKENFRKASIICSQSDVEALGGCTGSTPERLSADLTRLQQRLRRESERFTESIEDLRIVYDKKERRISKKRELYKSFRDNLEACQRALDLRWSKFRRNATLLKRQLTWQFNGHLKRKGISGNIKVNYEEKTLCVEVRMPQDASGAVVSDTRGLSGGERSFSTLCFAMALHEMTESPFRAMDEFDVFMDAVSRKISLDTLLEFAVAQGSQWIFITPHDISMVKSGDRIKRLQLQAPRS